MSGTPPIRPGGLPTDAVGRDALAGEYVLGTLDARTAARVTVAMQADPEWRLAVEEWEARLAPLADGAKIPMLRPRRARSRI